MLYMGLYNLNAIYVLGIYNKNLSRAFTVEFHSHINLIIPFLSFYVFHIASTECDTTSEPIPSTSIASSG